MGSLLSIVNVIKVPKKRKRRTETLQIIDENENLDYLIESNPIELQQ